MKCFALGVFGALLVAALSVVLLPQYANYTARAQAIEWLALVQPAQTQIEALAIKRLTLQGAGDQLALPAFPAKRGPGRVEIGPNGDILLVGVDVMMLLQPSLVASPRPIGASEARVAWRCIGAPLQNLPASCQPGVR